MAIRSYVAITLSEGHKIPLIRNEAVRFGVYLGTKAALTRHVPNIVAMRVLPAHFTDVHEYVSKNTLLQSGYMEYSLERDGGDVVAETRFVYPKFNLPTHGLTAPRLGYAAEQMTTAELMSGGVTHITTTEDPSESRRGQLKRVGLNVLQPTPIGKWISAMRKGVNLQQRVANEDRT